MHRPPIFLYSSWRTGGTALAIALRANENTMLFYDPLNQGLRNYEFAKIASSDTWHSNHPSGFNYFDEYLDLFIDGKLQHLPDMSGYKFRNSSELFQNQLIRYLEELIAVANQNNKTAVFKFEQLEGHFDLLKKHFPSAVHLSLVRNRSAQFNSWLEQLALGSSGFFDSAFKLISEDPDFFTNGIPLENPTVEEVFEVYQSHLHQLTINFDLTFDLYEDNREKFLSKIPSESFRKVFYLALIRLETLEKPPTFEQKFIRMTRRSLELIQERNKLIQERNELIQQRNELTNSTMWRMTSPIRWLINFIKR